MLAMLRKATQKVSMAMHVAISLSIYLFKRLNSDPYMLAMLRKAIQKFTKARHVAISLSYYLFKSLNSAP